MKSDRRRSRLIIQPDTCARLKDHVRLQFDPVRQRYALLSPEKVMWPDEISLDILNRCDGETSADNIINALAEEYEADIEQVRGDVLDFLQTWSDRRLIEA